MEVVVVNGSAGSQLADELLEALAQADAPARLLDLQGSPGESALEHLAGALRLAEADLAANVPSAVVVVDDGDESLAAALAATKIEVPLIRLDVAVASDAETTARIDTLLADFVVPADPAEAAAAIAEKLRANAPPAPPF